ncbi:MAG: TSUP family transporter [Thermoplasmata archaeon]
MEEKRRSRIAWLKQQSFTIALLVVIACFWALSANLGLEEPAEVPQVRATIGAALLVVGFSAGLLGGLIGTGGCSVMLPILHFWLGYPAPVAIGTTLLR